MEEPVYYIAYRISRDKFEAGPFYNWLETKSNAKDISSYINVFQVEIITNFTEDLVISRGH